MILLSTGQIKSISIALIRVLPYHWGVFYIRIQSVQLEFSRTHYFLDLTGLYIFLLISDGVTEITYVHQLGMESGLRLVELGN